MNKTHWEHAGYAILMVIPFALAGHAWAGAIFASAFFLGREHSQAQTEYAFGDFEAFNILRWSLDGKLDLIFPVVASSVTAIGFTFFQGGNL